MSEVLIQLRSKREIDEKLGQIQISSSFTAKELNSYVNSLFNQNNNYNFFINNQPLNNSIQDLIDSQNLNLEDVIFVDYICLEEYTSVFAKDFNDLISCIGVFKEELHVGCYDGSVHVFCVEDGALLKKRCYNIDSSVKEIKNGCLLSSRNEILELTKKDLKIYESVNQNEMNLILKDEEVISCMDRFNEIIAYGKETGDVNIYKDGKVINLCKCKDYISGICIKQIKDSMVVVAGSISNELAIYNIDKNKECKLDVLLPITTFYMTVDYLFLGTSSSKVLVFRNGEFFEEKDVGIRYSDFIKGKENILAIAGQFDVVIYEISNNIQIGRIRVEDDEGISGLEWMGNMLIVANGKTIRGYYIKH